MADNLTTQTSALSSVASGTAIATDDVGGVHFQKIKIDIGGDGVSTVLSNSNPLPVGQSGTWNIGTVTAVTAISNALPAGTNAIGKLAANSGVDIGDVDVTSLTPGTGATNLGKAEDAAHTTGDVGVMLLAVRQDTASALAGTTGDYIPLSTTASGNLRIAIAEEEVLQTKYASISAGTSGNNTLVAAVTSKKIRVHSLFLVAPSAVTAKFQSGAGGTDISGTLSLAANGGFVLPYNPYGWFETGSNTLLNLSLGGAVTVGGSLTYTEV